VVFRYPEDRSKDFIKRVIATEGDTIEIRDKIIYINGKKSLDGWGRYQNTSPIPGVLSPKDNMKPVTVPKNSYFVMGDNRDKQRRQADSGGLSKKTTLSDGHS